MATRSILNSRRKAQRLGALLLIAVLIRISQASSTPVVVSPDAPDAEATAATELSVLLTDLFPNDQFPVMNIVPGSGNCIVVGTRSSLPQLSQQVAPEEVDAPGEFVAKVVQDGERRIGLVCGRSPIAVLHGVYALLEQKFGYGFYLTHNARENAVDGAFSFDRWSLSDRPVIGDRVLFTWHNFLSGCSVWDLEDWKHWVRQAARMRFTHIMVHNYANNPMRAFSHEGYEHPVGWLNSTEKGRTYAVEHVWDMRNVPGAPDVFTKRVFGSEAGRVPDSLRVQSAKNMMKQVFAYAHRFGLKVVYVIDVGTIKALPQEMIKAVLPESARFLESQGNDWIPKPDEPEAQAYYESLLEDLLTAYPDVDEVVSWVRSWNATPATRIDSSELPDDWRADYHAKLVDNPAAQVDNSAPMYWWSKVAESWRVALDNLGLSHVAVGYASNQWQFDRFHAANVFFPHSCRMYLTESQNGFNRNSSIRASLATFAAVRPVTVIQFPHHDDGKYCGRPFTAPTNFADKLQEARCSGFGVLHWMTRPLDLFVKNIINQTWAGSLNEQQATTIEHMASDFFGSAHANAMSSYLTQWMSQAPQFGWETGDEFAPSLPNASSLVADCEMRISLLNDANPATMTQTAYRRWLYFQKHEEWIKRMFQETAKLNDTTGNSFGSANPESAIVTLAEAAKTHDLTKGEMGLIASLCTRWLPYFTERKQREGNAPFGVNLLPTNHDPSSRKPGRHTYYYDRQQRCWAGMGEKETGVPAFSDTTLPLGSTAEDVCATWSESSQGFTIDAGGVRNTPSIPDGQYTVVLYFPAHLASVAHPRTVGISLEGALLDTVELQPGKTTQTQEYRNVTITGGTLQVGIHRIEGDPVLSAVLLGTDEAVHVRGPRNVNPVVGATASSQTVFGNALKYGIKAGRAVGEEGTRALLLSKRDAQTELSWCDVETPWGTLHPQSRDNERGGQSGGHMTVSASGLYEIYLTANRPTRIVVFTSDSLDTLMNAYVPVAVDAAAWYAFGEQKSEPAYLETGKRYRYAVDVEGKDSEVEWTIGLCPRRGFPVPMAE